MARVPRSTVAPSAGLGQQRLDTAVTKLIAAQPPPAVRAELEGFYAAIAARGVVGESLDPPSLSGLLFTLIMPRISQPRMLNLDRRTSMLQSIADTLSANSTGDAGLRGGLVAVQRELRSLTRLRLRRDGLIEG